MVLKLAVLGATGTIGRRTVEVAEHLGASVAAISARRASPALFELIERLRPEAVCVTDTAEAEKAAQWGMNATLLAGERGLIEAALWPGVDCVVVAVLGIHGLGPTLAALRDGRRVALANKETLVAGGPLVEATGRPDLLYPVDSEHAALFHLLGGREPAEVSSLTLTASGGALRDWPVEALSEASVRDVLRHPVWAMGDKITVDSATMMNKGLELIEAHFLFSMPYDKLRVLIHPETIVHGLINCKDGSSLAQLALPDMALPIQAAICGHHAVPSPVAPLDFSQIPPLTFRQPDPRRYPSLSLALSAGKLGGTFPVALNAANEEAVAAFLAGRLAFTRIPVAVERTLEQVEGGPASTLEQVMDSDRAARRRARTILEEEATC